MAVSIARAVIAPVWLIVNAEDGSETEVCITAWAMAGSIADPTPVITAVRAPWALARSSESAEYVLVPRWLNTITASLRSNEGGAVTNSNEFHALTSSREAIVRIMYSPTRAACQEVPMPTKWIRSDSPTRRAIRSTERCSSFSIRAIASG